MTTEGGVQKYVWSKALEDKARALLSIDLPVRYSTDELTSILVELVHGTETLCRTREFISKLSLAFAITLGLARESRDDVKLKLLEKTIEIMNVGFRVVEMLRSNKLSCVAIEDGAKALEEILDSVDKLIGIDAS